MKTKVSRWGNSLALRLPKKLVTSYQLSEDDPVEIIEQEGGLLLRPCIRKEYDLDDLLAGVTKDNLHREILTGEKRGGEVW